MKSALDAQSTLRQELSLSGTSIYTNDSVKILSAIAIIWKTMQFSELRIFASSSNLFSEKQFTQTQKSISSFSQSNT
jgi:hypothetical protein